MKPNRQLSEAANTIQQILSEARNTGIVPDEGVQKLVEAMVAVGALASLVTPVPDACRLAEWAANEVAGEIASCIAFRNAGTPVQWSYAGSSGFDLLRASVDIAMAEIIARRIGFYLHFDNYDLEVAVGPSSCECEEPCYEVFDVLDTKELIGFLRACEELALAECENGPH